MESAKAQQVIARQDRIPVWSLPGIFIWVIGIGFLFTFFDVTDVAVSFIQTCGQIVPHCTPESAANYIGLPTLLSLIGYMIGTLVLSPLSDRFGRRDMLLVTMALTGVGSLFTSFVGTYALFNVGRFITGVGIGADLAIVNTYINEMAPTRERGKQTALIFILSATGAWLGVWLGLVLTTPPSPWPLGLPFAVATPGFDFGWRVMYWFGALLAVVGILLRFQLPESARWLISRGRVVEAEAVVASMERQASRRVTLPEPSLELPVIMEPSSHPYRDIFFNRVYLGRMIVLLITWLIAYVTIYSFVAGLPSMLAALKYPPPEAGLIDAVGVFGMIGGAVFMYFYGESLERKLWLPVGAVITMIGAIVLGVSGLTLWVSFLGAILIWLGFNLWVPMAYSWSTECFPARSRATGFALVDGIGHVGGGIGLIFLAPLAVVLGTLSTVVLVAGFLWVAAIVAQFGVPTRNKQLDVVSP